jgi:phosphatidylglycerophosphate synthase
MLHNEPFRGDQKVGLSLLGKIEKRFIESTWRYFPKWIEGYHLTLTTIVWSIGTVLFGFLAQYNNHWLWGSSLMLLLQWFTDSFDGALGRNRDTGIPRWGYYMDHFLDYIFLCSILIGYAFIVNDQFNTQFFILAVFGGFMFSSHLAFAANNELKIEYLKIGPTEIRLIFILINTAIIFFGRTHLAWTLPYILILSVCGLIYTVYETQKRIWKKDMDIKNQYSP